MLFEDNSLTLQIYIYCALLVSRDLCLENLVIFQNYSTKKLILKLPRIISIIYILYGSKYFLDVKFNGRRLINIEQW